MCFTSSLHPHHLSFPLSPINKILHSPGYMEVTDRVRQFFHWLIYISFCSNTGFSLLLYALTHTGDLVAILWHQTYALFFFPFPTALFLLQSSCLWSSDELLLKKEKKENTENDKGSETRSFAVYVSVEAAEGGNRAKYRARRS